MARQCCGVRPVRGALLPLGGGASGGDPSTRPPCTSGMVLRALCSGMLAAGRAKSAAPGAGVTTGDLREVGVAGAGVATAALVLRTRGKGRINPEERLRQGAAQEGSGCWGQGATGLGPAFDVIPPGGASEPESATSSARRVLAEVTYRVAEEEKLEDVTRKRSREKGSKVTPQGESAAGRVEGRQRMRALDKECGGVQRGVDVLGVRRCDAPPLRLYARGAFERARAMLASPSQRKAGVEKLRSEVHAATSRRTRISRIKTLRRLSAEAGVHLLPVTNAGMELLAAALKAGMYSSAVTYLKILKQLHTQAGHPWTADLEETRIECSRTLGRGIGPAKRAAVVRLEALPGRWEQAGTAIDVAVVGAIWLLRGAEVGAILVEHAEVAQDEKSACLWLGPTKTNPSGKECQRILRCACRSGDDMFIGTRVRPVHALQRILRRQVAAGFTSKHPIVSGSDGLALSPVKARRLIALGLGTQALNEHSLRRMGAQFYARRGVFLSFVQVLGRWRSATIERYVADALAEKAWWAPLAAAQDWDTSDILGAMGTQGGAGTSVHALSGWIKQCVRTELRAHGTEAHGMTQALGTEVHARSDSVAHVAEHLGGGDQGADRVEHPAEDCELPGQAGGDEVRPVDVVGERAIRATRTGVVHLVRVGGTEVHPSCLVAWCGWRFATGLSADGDSSGAGAGRARARPAWEPRRVGPTTQAVIVQKKGEQGE